MHRVHLTQSIGLAGSPDAQRLSLRSAPSAATAASGRSAECASRPRDAARPDRCTSHRCAIVFRASARSTTSGSACSTNSGYAERSRSSILPDRILRQVGEPGPCQQLDDLGGQVVPDLVRSDSTLFSHFHLLAQLVADALQPLAHRGVVDAGVGRESRRAPAVRDTGGRRAAAPRASASAARSTDAAAAPPTIASPPRRAPARPGRRPGTAASGGAPAAC